MQPSDDELVHRIRIHDEEAFELFFKRYKSMVYRYSRYLTLNGADAEDLFQDTWLRVAKCLPAKGRIENLRAWLCSITTNLHRDFLRKKYRRILFRDRPPSTDAVDKNYECSFPAILVRLSDSASWAAGIVDCRDPMGVSGCREKKHERCALGIACFCWKLHRSHYLPDYSQRRNGSSIINSVLVRA